MSRVLLRLLSRVDAMVARVENHEGLVQRALADEREKLARVERELARVRRHAALLDQAWRSAIDERLGWLQRARTEPDETVALECLRQAKRARGRAAEHNEQCHQQAELVRRLEALSVRLGERLRQLEERHELLHSRETNATLARADQRDLGSQDSDVPTLLRRWEASIEKVAQRADATDDEPDNALGLEPEDDEVFLKLELAELRRESQ